MSVASRTILSNFFEEQCPQSHPQYLSGSLRALFPTSFLEIAVYAGAKWYAPVYMAGCLPFVKVHIKAQ